MTPQRWVDRQQGSIVIARNPNPVKRKELPEDLRSALDNPVPWIREGAVRELGRLMISSDKDLALAAEAELRQRKQRERDVHVLKAIEKILGALENVSLQSPPITERKQLEPVKGLLDEAERALKTERLTSPTGDNAYEYYQAVLALDPTNAQAKRGLGRIVTRYLKLAEEAGRQRQYDRAEYFLVKAEAIEPEAEAVRLARERLAERARPQEVKLPAAGEVFRDTFHALVRILDANPPRRAVGAGFLVSERHVLTCAHVVAQALDLSSNSPSAPADPVWLDLPLVPGAAPLRAKSIDWYPVKKGAVLGEIEDIAVLELETSLPNGAQPAPTMVLNDFLDRAVWLYGFPEGREEGDHQDGQLKSPIANGWVQLDPELGRRGVAPGFSGTPVWDKQENAVVGMIVSVQGHGGEASAYMIPMTTLIKAWPKLAPNPYRGLEAFREEDAEYFFGRDGDIQRLVDAVRRDRLVAVIGASGSGKTSLVFAGLVPRLRAQDRRWLIVPFKPKGPFGELATALAPLLYPKLDKQAQRKKRNKILADLDSGELKLTDQVAILTQEHPGKRLLLIANQFEELYTQNLPEDRRRRFIDALTS